MGGSGGNSSTVLKRFRLTYNFLITLVISKYLDAIGGISIPNYDSQLDAILTQVTNSNTVWVAGVNCVNNQSSGVIGVGGIDTELPVCPQ